MQRRLHHTFSSINQSGKHLLQLINDILDLSKLEAGKLELHYMSIPIQHFIDALTKSFNLKWKKKAVVQDSYCRRARRHRRHDVRLKQIMLNLVSNAIKFSHPKTQLR